MLRSTGCALLVLLLLGGPLASAGTSPRAGFGKSVAGAGDVNGDGFDDVIVGADSWRNPESGEGAGFVYFGAASATFAEQPDWQVEIDQAGARFGTVVAGIGDVNNDGYDDILVATRYYDNPASVGILEGLVAIYHGSISGLPATPNTSIVGQFDFQRLGWAAAGAGDVNNDGFDDVVILGVDGVYVHNGSAAGLNVAPSQTLQTGGSLAGAGDVNNDGFDDLIVGNRPNASVHLGSLTGLAATPFWETTIFGATDFGQDVAGAGDVNNDGFADVIVSDGIEGQIYGFYGPALSSHDWFVNPGSLAGESISTAGDVNNDGFDDVIVGYARYSSERGRFYVYLGSSTGLNTGPVSVVESPLAEEWLGWAVAAAGDIDNDGFDDVIVGNCPTCGVSTQAYESARVYRGRVGGVWSGLPVTVDLDIAGPAGVLTDSLRIRKSGSDLILTWDPAECHEEGILDYAIYEGTLGDFYGHLPALNYLNDECVSHRPSTDSIFPSPGNTYYLVVPRRTDVEGSYGLNSAGDERPASAQPCVPQSVATCP